MLEQNQWSITRYKFRRIHVGTTTQNGSTERVSVCLTGVDDETRLSHGDKDERATIDLIMFCIPSDPPLTMAWLVNMKN